MTDAEILFEKRGHIGLVTLNRPHALNSLTAGMCHHMRRQLNIWALDQAVRAVVVIGAGEKAFCAGGDVVKVSKSYQAGGTQWSEFFTEEYKMNVTIDEFPKPYIALVDGIAMGGGVGISVPGDFWVATEKTLFAMPETGLGLFPDVGGGWFLPRLPGAVGMYLALTGARMKAGDLYGIGLASHVVKSADIPAIIDALSDEADGGADSIDAILARFHSEPEAGPTMAHMADIDRLFSAATIGSIISACEDADSEFAAKQASILATKSPMSLKLSFSQLHRGAELVTFRANMVMEYRMVNRVMAWPDFHEGVRAILIDKDHAPKWSPATLDGVSDTEIDKLFGKLDIDISFND